SKSAVRFEPRAGLARQVVSRFHLRPPATPGGWPHGWPFLSCRKFSRRTSRIAGKGGPLREHNAQRRVLRALPLICSAPRDAGELLLHGAAVPERLRADFGLIAEGGGGDGAHAGHHDSIL